MANRNHLDDEYLDLKAHRYRDVTFLGAMRMATRTGLFVLSAVLLLAALAALYLYVDIRMSAAISDLNAQHEMVRLVNRIEREIGEVRALERQFVIRRELTAPDAHDVALNRITAAVDGLLRLPLPDDVKQHAATLRDGLAQYSAQFGEMVKSARAGAGNPETQARVRASAQDVQTRLRTAGQAPLADRLGLLVQRGLGLRLPVAEADLAAIAAEYDTLAERLKEGSVPDRERLPLRNLLAAHRADMTVLLEARKGPTVDPQNFEDIFIYLAPSLEALPALADRLNAVAVARFDEERMLARQMLAGGGLGAVVLLAAIGLLLMGSVTSSVRAVSAAAMRLVGGDRGVVIPARGNVDAVGVLARSLDAWMDTMAEVDHLRAELEATAARLEQALAAAALADDEDTEPAPAPTEPRYRAPPPDGAATGTSLVPMDAGPSPDSIVGVSQQLSNVSKFLTIAAVEVERTEELMQAVEDANGKIEELESIVVGLRDQTNLLAVRTAIADPRPGLGGENLVLFSPDQKTAAGVPEKQDDVGSLRFDSIRQSIDRAEATVEATRAALDRINEIGRDIASTSSAQALEATQRLLAQSEHLQDMLDGLLSRIQPLAGGPGRGDVKGIGRKPPAKGGPSRA
ncbi:MAG: methyl-accepting chemotaxis protein [Rhodospirillales bacterium]|nr:methyl-accepting chemotaxis protein [Rhodospirillales bacterium]